MSDQNYEIEEINIRSKIEEIYINEQLEGELDLADFTFEHKRRLGIRVYISGVRIYISHYVDESKIDLKNQRQSAKIIKLFNAQEWLD
jgi:hypothetical protein